jgi:catechol 2,3-dioxygenase
VEDERPRDRDGYRPLDLRALIRAADGQRWDGLPTGTTVGHVHFHVQTLEAAQAFYHRALGFDIVVWSYPGALFFSAGGYHHHVGTNTWAGEAPLDGPDDARLLEWELVLPTKDDIAAAWKTSAQPATTSAPTATNTSLRFIGHYRAAD